MPDTLDFFSSAPPMRGFRGDTFPVFYVAVDWNYSLDSCSMDIVLEPKYTPGTAVLTKACSKYSRTDEEGFTVQLTSDETANLLGVYNVFFIMKDQNDKRHIKLHITLEVLECPEVT